MADGRKKRRVAERTGDAPPPAGSPAGDLIPLPGGDQGGALAAPQAARLRVALGSATLEAELRASPAGLLAIGGMAGAILLGSAAIVAVALGPARRRAGGTKSP